MIARPMAAKKIKQWIPPYSAYKRFDVKSKKRLEQGNNTSGTVVYSAAAPNFDSKGR
jgi:hypothetical protein